MQVQNFEMAVCNLKDAVSGSDEESDDSIGTLMDLTQGLPCVDTQILSVVAHLSKSHRSPEIIHRLLCISWA